MSKKDKKEDIETEELIQEQTDAEQQTSENQTVEQPSIEEKLQGELKQEKDKFLRLFAEFENYKKRTTKERIELFATASEDVMKTLLPVIDDFERALSHIEDNKEAKALGEGVSLIYKKLMNSLEQKGLVAMNIEKGADFDADNHEAITQIPAPSDDLKGKIIDIVVKGYKLGDKIIRFPKVVIGQ